MAKSVTGSVLIGGTTAAATAALAYAFVLRPRMLRWGASDGEM